MRALLAVFVCVVAVGCGAPHPPYDDARATQRLSVALVSQRPEADAALNRSRMVEAIERVARERPDVRLIAFGELSLGLYWKGFDEKYQHTVAEPLDGETVTTVRALAAQHHVFIVFGFAESGDGALFNSAVVIDDAGAIVAHKRKAHLVPMDEAGGFAKGERTVPTFFIDGVKTALLICNDFNDPVQREAVAADAEVRLVLLPQASAGLKAETVERSPYPFVGAWMLAPQRRGWEGIDQYHGSLVVDPNGAVPARGTEELLFTELRFVPTNE